MDKAKVIILDFDGTVYSGDHGFDEIEGSVMSHKREFLCWLSDDEYKMIERENPEWKTIYWGSEVAKFIYALRKKYPKLKISMNEFWNWQNEKPYPLVLEGTNTVDKNLLKKLCEKYPVYIVSNSSPTHVLHYMKIFGYDPAWFVKIISNKFTIKDFTKGHYYKSIMQKENCKPSEVFVFGDSRRSDLAPAKLLDMPAFHIKQTIELEECIKKLI